MLLHECKMYSDSFALHKVVLSQSQIPKPLSVIKSSVQKAKKVGMEGV